MVSCAPQTPASRIEQRPEVFARLSEQEKQLVMQGDIGKGMDKDAVLLSWGPPAATADGLRGGKRVERWDYEASRPVVTHEFHSGYDSGILGSYTYHGVGAGFRPHITFVPYRQSTVWFVGDRVNEWERLR